MANKFSVEEIKELAGIFAEAVKHTPGSTTLTATPLQGVFHGNTAQYGIFTTPGVRPQRYSTLTRPYSLMNIVGVERSDLQTEMLEIMTGQTDVSCTNASGWCGTPPTAGQLKVCKQNYSWGQFYMKTQLNAIPEIGTLKNRADVPGEILNAGPTGHPFIPDLMFRMEDTRSQLQHEFYTVGVETERSFGITEVQGDNTLAYTSTKCGWIKEFNGLDKLIKTGHTDAETGIACPAVDSAVVTYSANVNTTTADGRNIVQVMDDTFYGLRQRARKMGMDATQWVIVMREELFRSLVEQYVCKYNIYACSGAQYAETNPNMEEANRMRIEMLNGMYLIIQGIRVPVVFSEGIPQTTPASNTFESDLYFVPVNWAGQNLLKIQYFPMDNQYIQEFINFAGTEMAVLNNGLWLVGSAQTPLCKEYHFASKMRMILETPFLAGRIDNLQYTFAAPIRNALPGASYYANGGLTYRS